MAPLRSRDDRASGRSTKSVGARIRSRPQRHTRIGWRHATMPTVSPSNRSAVSACAARRDQRGLRIIAMAAGASTTSRIRRRRVDSAQPQQRGLARMTWARSGSPPCPSSSFGHRLRRWPAAPRSRRSVRRPPTTVARVVRAPVGRQRTVGAARQCRRRQLWVAGGPAPSGNTCGGVASAARCPLLPSGHRVHRDDAVRAVDCGKARYSNSVDRLFVAVMVLFDMVLGRHRPFAGRYRYPRRRPVTRQRHSEKRENRYR